MYSEEIFVRSKDLFQRNYQTHYHPSDRAAMEHL